MQAEFPKELRYTREHEWVGPSGDGLYAVGITAFAAEQLGDVTYVELPNVGKEFGAGASAAAVESVKAASDVYAPVGGQVAATNERLESEPELVNQSPYGDGWFFKLSGVDAQQLERLMTADQYAAYVQEQDS